MVTDRCRVLGEVSSLGSNPRLSVPQGGKPAALLLQELLEDVELLTDMME